jgi:HEAT repeat protein
MIQECLLIIESGDIDDLFEIIPRIGVLRDRRFHEPLYKLLKHKNLKRREFAAYSMGAIGNSEFVDSLKTAFHEARQARGTGAEQLQIAIIEAIGVIGDDASVEFFIPMLKSGGDRRKARKVGKWVLESLGTIAQQGGKRSLEALLELTYHDDPEIQAQALSELSVAYWHRPNEIAESILERLYELTSHKSEMVAESAIAALQSLADVGCRRAENLFSPQENL